MDIERGVTLLKMMSNPIRLRILKILSSKNGICVSGIEDIMNIPQPSISQHLAHLRNSGIIKCDKKGKKVCYGVIDKDVLKILNSMDIDDDMGIADCEGEK